MNELLVISIIQAILKFGPEAVIKIAEVIKSNSNISAEDINKLFIEDDPRDYFYKGR